MMASANRNNNARSGNSTTEVEELNLREEDEEEEVEGGMHFNDSDQNYYCQLKVNLFSKLFASIPSLQAGSSSSGKKSQEKLLLVLQPRNPTLGLMQGNLKLLSQDSSSQTSLKMDESKCFEFWGFNKDLGNRNGEHFNMETDEEEDAVDAGEGCWSIDEKALKGCLALFSRHASDMFGHGGTSNASTKLFKDQDPFSKDLENSALSCSIHIDLESSLLKLILQEKDLKTTCLLNLYEPLPILDMDQAFLDSPLALKLVLESHILKDSLSVMDDSCCRLQLNFVTTLTCKKNHHPHHSNPCLVFESRGTVSTIVVKMKEILLDSWELFDDDEMSEEAQDEDIGEEETITYTVSRLGFSYEIEKVKSCCKALSKSVRTQIRINQRGIMSIQSMIPHSDGSGDFSFIDTLVLPLIDEDD